MSDNKSDNMSDNISIEGRSRGSSPSPERADELSEQRSLLRYQLSVQAVLTETTMRSADAKICPLISETEKMFERCLFGMEELIGVKIFEFDDLMPPDELYTTISMMTMGGHVPMEDIRHTLSYESTYSVLQIFHQMRSGLMRAMMAAHSTTRKHPTRTGLIEIQDDGIVSEATFAEMPTDEQYDCITTIYVAIRKNRTVIKEVLATLKGIINTSKNAFDGMEAARACIMTEVLDSFHNDENQGAVIEDMWRDLQDETNEANYEMGSWSQKLTNIRTLILWKTWTKILEIRDGIHEIISFFETAAPQPRQDPFHKRTASNRPTQVAIDEKDNDNDGPVMRLHADVENPKLNRVMVGWATLEGKKVEVWAGVFRDNYQGTPQNKTRLYVSPEGSRTLNKGDQSMDCYVPEFQDTTKAGRLRKYHTAFDTAWPGLWEAVRDNSPYTASKVGESAKTKPNALPPRKKQKMDPVADDSGSSRMDFPNPYETRGEAEHELFTHPGIYMAENVMGELSRQYFADELGFTAEPELLLVKTMRQWRLNTGPLTDFVGLKMFREWIIKHDQDVAYMRWL